MESAARSCASCTARRTRFSWCSLLSRTGKRLPSSTPSARSITWQARQDSGTSWFASVMSESLPPTARRVRAWADSRAPAGLPTLPIRGGGRVAEDGFVGRERELAVLTAALTDARAGRSRVVLIAGEPGIGKTRLAARVADAAEGDGALVAWARSHEDGGAPPYWLWR